MRVQNGLNPEKLSRIISEVLELPLEGRWGRAYKISKAVIQALTNLALTGEDISIAGFGIFRWHTKPAGKSNTTYFYNPKRPVHIMKDIPAKRYLSFQPSKTLKRMLKETDLSE